MKTMLTLFLEYNTLKDKMDEEESHAVGLPGPLHRILIENSGVRSPLRNCKNELSLPQSLHKTKSPSPKEISKQSTASGPDKENVLDRQRMELGPQPRYNSSPRMDSEVELSCLAMDDSNLSMLPPSHLQRQLSTTTPERYKNSTFITTDNISSILTHSQTSSNQISLSEIHSPSSLEGSKFKTPKRSVPKSSEKTPNSCPPRTPNSSSKSGSSGRRFNPFDSHRSSDVLQNGLNFSPGVFATVVSPSQECSDESRPFWTLEQQSELYPHPISEDSPLKQSLYVKGYDPNDTEMENKTQEAIEKYFAENHSVTSPPDLPPTGPLLNSSSDKDMSYSQPCQSTANKWSQTTLTFPKVIPAHLESILKQFFTFQEPQVMSEEQCNLSNSTLRRKLFNGEMGGQGSDEESERSASPDSEDDHGPRGDLLTPGRVIHTPVQSRTSPKELWSSSPVRHGGITSSLSPPDHMGSPILSPIGKERRTCLQESIARLEEGDEEGDDEGGDNGEEMKSEKGDASDEMWQTAEITENQRSIINMDTDSQPVWPKEEEQTPQTPSQVGPSLGWQSSQWSLTLPTQDETNADSNALADTDTGYTTNTRSLDNTNTIDQTPSLLPHQQHADSGVSTSQQQPADLTGSVLGAIPPPADISVLGAMPQTAKSPYLVSYANDTNTNDISVGFPLGSSTPSKK